MPNPSFSVRIGSTGKAELRSDFAEIRKDGVESQQEIAAASEAAAKRATTAYDRATQDMLAADRRRAAAADKISAMSPTTPRQFAAEAAAGPAGGLSGKSAQDSAAAIRALLQEEQNLEAKTHALKMAYDPLYAAQTRFNEATGRSTELLAAGRITQEMHNRVLTEEEIALRRAKEAVEGHAAGHVLNRAQIITGQSAVMRFTDAVIAGANPLKAFALEAHKGAEMLSMDDAGMAGGLSKVRALLNPVTLGIVAVTLATGVAAYAGFKYAEDLDKLSLAADGFGRASQLTGEQLQATAEKTAAAGDVTVSSAMATEEAILHSTRTSGEALSQAIVISQRLADAMGTDLAGANKLLAEAMVDPAKGADELTRKFGYLDDQQLQNIHELMEQNRLTDAQSALLGALDKSLDKTGEHVNALTQNWRDLKVAVSGAMAAMGKAFNEAYDRETGQQSNKEKISDLKSQIDTDRANLQHWVFDRAGIEKEIRDKSAEIRRLEMADVREAGNARHNQLTQEVMDVERASGATNRYSLKLEEHRRVIAMLKQAQREGIAVDPQVLAGKEHQLRGEELIGGDGNREAAIQAARARMKRAQPHSPERQQAAADLEAVMTAGRDMTDDQAAAAAKSRGEGALGHQREHIDRHAESLRRQAEAMRVDTAETLKLADAWLEGSDKALLAEARRKGLTDATKKGSDVEAQAQRQLALDIAQQAAAGAKAVSHLRDESAIRREVNERVSAGTLAAADMSKAMADEAALRPLLKLRTIAHGEALATLTRIIDAYTKSLGEAHAEEARSAAITATDAATRQTEDILKLIPFAGNPHRRSVEAARLAAEHEADDKHFEGADRTNFLRSRAGLAGAQVADGQSQYIAQTKQAQEDSLALTRRELQLVGANDNFRTAELDKLKTILALKKEGIDPESEDGKAILANVAALDQEAARLKLLQANWDELKQVGSQFIDDVLNPDNWKSFGDFGMMILKDLEKELIKLAAINPLKNWLFGEKNSTAGGIFDLLKKILPGGSGGGGGSWGEGDWEGFTELLGSIPGFASGTDDSPAGLAIVGEQGRELVNLPGGSQVIPAAQTRRMLAANDSGIGSLHVDASIYAPGADPAMLAQVVEGQRRIIREMPGRVVDIVNDARQRRLIA